MELTIEQIGPYRIQSEIGRGGMAVVYQAIDTRSNMTVALKVLPPTLATHDATLKRFIREGENAARLVHENIVQVFESGMADGYHYISMELIRGQPLDEQVIKNGSLLSIDETVVLLSELAAGLDYAHSMGVLHRDIKPGNVLVADSGRVLLADFGVARQLLAEQTMYTVAGQSVGTPAYMSPEQARGQQNIDYRSDVYSFGVLAYKLFTGRVPFHSTDQLQIMRQVVLEAATPAHEVNPDIPLHISQTIQKCLAKNPDERFESAGAFMGAVMAGYRPQNELVDLARVAKSNIKNRVAGFAWYDRLNEKRKERSSTPSVPNPLKPNIEVQKRTARVHPVPKPVATRRTKASNSRGKRLVYTMLGATLLTATVLWGATQLDGENALERLSDVSTTLNQRVSEIDPQAVSQNGIESVKERADSLAETSSELRDTALETANAKADEFAAAVEEQTSGMTLPEEQIGEVINHVWYPQHSINKLRSAIGESFDAASEWISNRLSGNPEVSSSE